MSKGTTRQKPKEKTILFKRFEPGHNEPFDLDDHDNLGANAAWSTSSTTLGRILFIYCNNTQTRGFSMAAQFAKFQR